MKKNYKILGCLSLAVLLTACNGADITKEEAKTKANDIVTYQTKHGDELYKDGIHYKAEGKDDTGATMTEEYWYNSNSKYLHYTSKSCNANTTTEVEFYYGMIDSKYYSIDVKKKEYTEYSNETTYKLAFMIPVAAVTGLMTYGSTVLTDLVNTDAEEGETITYKSKGDGHIFVEYVSDETTTIIFENNRFVSYSSYSNIVKDSYEKCNFDYNVKASMPSLNGYTKK